MIKIKTQRDKQKLRRLALSSQGLLKPNAFGKGIHGAQTAIEHLGYVQIDTISVVERAHHHVLHTRIDNYSNDILNALLKSNKIFEYWSHAAAFLPFFHYRFSLPYKAALKSGQTHWYKNPDKKLMAKVLDRIKLEGPMRSRDFENTKTQQGGWWDWKPAKKAIEQLYMEGDLMVVERAGFQKVYDLTERVLPQGIDVSMPSIDEFAEHMISQQLLCHGFVTPKSITYLRKNPALKVRVKELLKEKLAEGELDEILMPSGEVFVCNKSALETCHKSVSDRLLILSPFDNMTIQRQRLSEIFNFDYQIECYVPEPKRRFGYFSLPLLYRDLFIGRMDCKAHRKEKHFEIKALYFESELVPNKNIDIEKLSYAFTKAVKQFMRFQGCDSVSITKTSPEFMRDIIRKLD